MRLEPIPVAKQSSEQKALDAEMREGVKKYLHGFQSEREDGALIGPFPAMVQFPEFGKPAWDIFMSLAKNSTLPKSVHEVAILVTGARLNSRYELYSHERVADAAGLDEDQIATITAGQRPPDLSDKEGVAYDVAYRLSGGGQLGDTLYRRVVKAFGDKGTAELFYLIGCYQMISTLLNGYDVPVPE